MTENSMIERIEVLERQNRRMWRIGAGVIFVAGAMLLMGQAPAARTIEANEFVLRDSKGTARARLSMDGDMPKLILLNANGKDGVVLYQASDTSGISLNDGNGRERAFLYASNSGSGLRIEDGEQTLADLTGSSMLKGAYFVLQKSGVGNVNMSVGDKPSISIHDAEGFQATLGSADLVTTRTGQTSKTSAASLLLFGKDKNVIWKAP